MKVYLVSYINTEGGHLEAFSSKVKARHKEAELKRNHKGEEFQLFDIEEKEFSISKKGILDALNYGADIVYK